MKNLRKIIQSDDKILSSNPALQFSSSELCVRVEFFDQFINEILKVSKQVCPILIHKYLRDEGGSKGVKLYNLFHHSRCTLNVVGERLKIQKSLESLVVKVIGRMMVLFDTGDDVRSITCSLLQEE